MPDGKLGELVDLISRIGFGDDPTAARDVLGQVYEYFLGQFASAEGKKGGQFYTPASIVKTLVAVLAPHKGKVYDPCCGSGGMFVQSEKFIAAHGGGLNLHRNLTVDWSQRESVRARLRIMVRRILRKYKYPPDMADAAVELVLMQAETLGSEWVVGGRLMQ